MRNITNRAMLSLQILVIFIENMIYIMTLYIIKRWSPLSFKPSSPLNGIGPRVPTRGRTFAKLPRSRRESEISLSERTDDHVGVAAVLRGFHFHSDDRPAVGSAPAPIIFSTSSGQRGHHWQHERVRRMRAKAARSHRLFGSRSRVLDADGRVPAWDRRAGSRKAARSESRPPATGVNGTESVSTVRLPAAVARRIYA
jgi:hypothetical protein